LAPVNLNVKKKTDLSHKQTGANSNTRFLWTIDDSCTSFNRNKSRILMSCNVKETESLMARQRSFL
jgi:hypothetical protein